MRARIVPRMSAAGATAAEISAGRGNKGARQRAAMMKKTALDVA